MSNIRSNYFTILLVCLMTLPFIQSACDNQCSGHGSCLVDDVCQCYDNWGLGLSHDSGDCSERICPYEISWIDSPDSTGTFHKYSECAGRGICNRQTGECQCFDGYEGKACARTTCPNDCSGHGTCEFIEDLAYGATWNEYSKQRFEDDPATFPYYNWDRQKVRGCVCDATYGDVDCSKRMCPYGNDVLDIWDDVLVSARYHTQQINFYVNYRPNRNLVRTFALKFKSRLNETFTTIPIRFDVDDLPDFANDIKLALLQLPNRVIDGVSVVAEQLYAYNDIMVNVTFTGNSVQGPQHLLSVLDYECGAGCTPKITGLFMETRHLELTPNVTNTYTDLHSFECGRRGKCDYTTGLCQCFLGYTGDNCNTMTTLV